MANRSTSKYLALFPQLAMSCRLSSSTRTFPLPSSTNQHIIVIYSSSKAALISLTNMMATELAHPSIGVRVNSIAPAVFPTESEWLVACMPGLIIY